MIKNFDSQKYGKIEYEESIWTGKKKLTVNGVSAKMINKTSFSFDFEEENVKAVVIGNIYKGSTLSVGSEKFRLYPKTLWYEYVLAFLPFILIMIWGNSVELCSIIPVVGGGIGGGISGALGVLSLSIMKTYDKAFLKIIMGIGFVIATFVLCAILGITIVNMLN